MLVAEESSCPISERSVEKLPVVIKKKSLFSFCVWGVYVILRDTDPRECLQGLPLKSLCRFQGMFGNHNGEKLMLCTGVEKMESLSAKPL